MKIVIGKRPNTEFARSISVREGTVRGWLNGTSLPGAEALMEIRRVHGYSVDWILTGTGSQKIDEAESVKCEASRAKTSAILRFRVAASAGLGAVSADFPEVDSVDLPQWVLERFDLRATNARVLSATGISMSPTIGDGDLLLVDVSKSARMPVDGSIYVLSIDDGLFVKRLRRSSEGWVLVSDNREMYPEEPIAPGRSVTIHGRVVWADRKL